MFAFMGGNRFDSLRRRMVEEQLERHGIRDERVLEALRCVPRHLFVPEEVAEQAYEDHPVAIGQGQTISQPYMVACMTRALQLRGRKILEIGSGSAPDGVLQGPLRGRLHRRAAARALSDRAQERIEQAGFGGVHTAWATASRGWPEGRRSIA
jgi:protein-L-isoaspartate(D-aspartate) O-methyltransferase